MHLSPRWLRLLSVLRRWFCCLLTFCLLLLPLLESVIVLCFVVRYFMSILVLQSSWWGRESWLLCLICLPGVSWWLGSSSSRCHGVVCSLWLWYFLIILTYYLCLSLHLSKCHIVGNHVSRLIYMYGSCLRRHSQICCPCCLQNFFIWQPLTIAHDYPVP